jgi:hypothetical protein
MGFGSKWSKFHPQFNISAEITDYFSPKSTFIESLVNSPLFLMLLITATVEKIKNKIIFWHCLKKLQLSINKYELLAESECLITPDLRHMALVCTMI